jgi:hypothetical protein
MRTLKFLLLIMAFMIGSIAGISPEQNKILEALTKLYEGLKDDAAAQRVNDARLALDKAFTNQPGDIEDNLKGVRRVLDNYKNSMIEENERDLPAGPLINTIQGYIDQELRRIGAQLPPPSFGPPPPPPGAPLPPPNFGPPPPPPGQVQAPVPPQRRLPTPPPVPPRTMPVKPGVEIAGRYKTAIMNTFDALISGLVNENDKKMAQGFKETLQKAYTEQNLTNMMNVWAQQLSAKLMRSGNQTFSSTKMVDSLKKLIATELNAQKKK